MAISFACECGKTLRTKDEFAGRRTRCPSCGTVLVIPLPTEPEVDDVYHVAPAEVPAVPDRSDGPRLRFGPAPSVGPADPDEPEGRTRPDVSGPEAITSGFSPREYLYWLLVVALIPLASSVLRPKADNTEHRFEQTLSHAPPEVKAQLHALAESGKLTRDVLLRALPGGRIDGALLSHDTQVHWVYAALAVAAFLALILSLFPLEAKKAGHLLMVGLFTGTIGIVFLLIVQFLAGATQGVWVRGRGIGVLLFYIAKFIGFSYSAANDPDTGFALSFLGFTCGVGLCEELCKALPLIVYFRRGGSMGWRGACAWGLASGVGFGVSEAIMYSADHYNGIGSAEIYVVRFVSCVALHALWTAAVGITLWKSQDLLQGHSNWAEVSLPLLRILAVPMVLHGLYDTLLKKDMDTYALAVGLASFAWFAWRIESARGTDEETARPGWAGIA
jgi:RsiW-degrading membrane proteinase PrsW (M82 family)